MFNMLCLLPNTAIKVDCWAKDGMDDWWMYESWCYGPHGKIGYWMETKK